MKKTVIDAMIDSTLIVEGSTIIVGFSGGPDSLCLLHALIQISEPYNLTIIPVHVNHKLRPSADDEAEACCRMCDRWGLECTVFEADCKSMAEDLGISLEEAGRYIRYDVFDEVAEDVKSNGTDEDSIFIALAHNADDQSETVLFRLLRGTGVHGLAGMPEVRASDGGYLIIRPILQVTREEIEKYIKENNLHPNIDESNFETDYTRNKIRNELIPYLEKNYNPNIKQALRRYAEIADVDDGAITAAAAEAINDCLEANEKDDSLELDITDLKDTSPAINRRIVGIILSALRLETKSNYELVVSLMNLIYSENPSAIIDLPSGYKAMREYNKIIFTENTELFESKKANDNLRLLPQVMKASEYKPNPDQVYAAFDFDEFNKKYPGKVGEIKLRTRQECDFIAIKGGSKKIQDFLVDDKVSKTLRDSLLMACIENEVLWILPNEAFSSAELQEKGKFSQDFQVTEATDRVLFLEISDILC